LLTFSKKVRATFCNVKNSLKIYFVRNIKDMF
jgi:hypothetical protein